MKRRNSIANWLHNLGTFHWNKGHNIDKAIKKTMLKITYEVELWTALLCVEVVTFQIRKGDDEKDEQENEWSGVQEAKRIEENVTTDRHLA